MSGFVQPIVTAFVGIVAGVVFVLFTYKSVTSGVAQRLEKEQREREQRKSTRRQGTAGLTSG
jgi:hypothetical protein